MSLLLQNSQEGTKNKHVLIKGSFACNVASRGIPKAKYDDNVWVFFLSSGNTCVKMKKNDALY